jgi:hypothetical protein
MNRPPFDEGLDHEGRVIPEVVEALRAINVARSRYPRLGANGFPVPPNWGYEIKRRTDLIEVDQVVTALTFLRLGVRTKRTIQCSYALKHQAEDWGALNGLSSYVSNGALICAAIYLGLSVVPRPENPNADIAISTRAVRRPA